MRQTRFHHRSVPAVRGTPGFNPRPCAGGDGACSTLPSSLIVFQSTPPRGGDIVRLASTLGGLSSFQHPTTITAGQESPPVATDFSTTPVVPSLGDARDAPALGQPGSHLRESGPGVYGHLQSGATLRVSPMRIDWPKVATFAAVARQCRFELRSGVGDPGTNGSAGAVAAFGGCVAGGGGGRDVVPTSARVRDGRQRPADVGAPGAVRGGRPRRRGAWTATSTRWAKRLRRTRMARNMWPAYIRSRSA